MKTNIDVIVNTLAGLVNCEAAPTMMSSEFLEILGALASLKQADYQSIGSRAATILLERMQAGMTAERTLKIMRGDNPMRPN